jgi:hypothetical protein
MAKLKVGSNTNSTFAQAQNNFIANVINFVMGYHDLYRKMAGLNYECQIKMCFHIQIINPQADTI